MNYSSTILKEYLTNKRITQVYTSENLTEVTSSCSDTSGGLRQLWHRNLNKSRDCLAVLLILPLLPGISRNMFLTEKIRNHIAQQAYRAKYEGEWRLVQELLELKVQTPAYQLEVVLRHKSTNALFGQISKDILRNSRGFCSKLAYLDPYKDSRPVVKAQRKRGYNDKGTPPDPQKLSLEYYFIRREVREDRRDNITLPRSHEWLHPQRI